MHSRAENEDEEDDEDDDEDDEDDEDGGSDMEDPADMMEEDSFRAYEEDVYQLDNGMVTVYCDSTFTNPITVRFRLTLFRYYG